MCVANTSKPCTLAASAVPMAAVRGTSFWAMVRAAPAVDFDAWVWTWGSSRARKLRHWARATG